MTGQTKIKKEKFKATKNFNLEDNYKDKDLSNINEVEKK